MMKNTPILLSAFFTTLFATSNVFAAIECPSVNEISANAYLLDTVWNSETAKSASFPIYRLYTSNNHTEFTGQSVFSSSAIKLKNRSWYLSWTPFKSFQSDNDLLQSAFNSASTVNYFLGELQSDGKRDTFALCVYLTPPNFYDDTLIPSIIAIYKQKDTPLMFNPDDFVVASNPGNVMMGKNSSIYTNKLFG